MGRGYGHWLALALLWAGLAGASVLPVAVSASAPRWDVVGCVGLSVAGVVWYFRARQGSYEAAARWPLTSVPERPPGVRLLAPWPLANAGLRRALTVAALMAPFAAVAAWASADDGRQPELGATLGGVGLAYALVCTWCVGYRRVRALESSRAASLVCEAVRVGMARTSRVTVDGWAAGVHRPHPEGASPVREVAARKGRAYPDAALRLRIPRRAGALRLSVAGGGERTLFLEWPAHPEGLAEALAGRQGWLYWSAAGRAGERSWTAPAILALGDGRYVQGWTQEGHDPLVPEGTPLDPAAVDGNDVVWQLRPVDPALLRRQRCRPALVLQALAVLSFVSVPAGAWSTDGEGPLWALTGALLLALAGLAVSGAVGAYRLHRAATQAAATATAPTILAPRLVPHPTPAPPAPPAPRAGGHGP